ncbi:MAG: hypothetical protein D6757_05415 [Alphaproteobacteria bacterium]|nr:MAG: hypothetical protein D6757_05415 [Alphaproteobacteria bacterium]
MRAPLLMLPFAALVLVSLLARWQVQEAREERFFGERILYHRHLRPPMQPLAVFRLLGFRVSEVPDARPRVPRRFLAALPKKMGEVRDTKLRKEIFLTLVLPLVLRADELLAEDRALLLQLERKVQNGQRLQRIEGRWLDAQGRRFGIAQGLTVASPAWFAEMKRRLDTIPPSLALAQSAIESGWGTARFAREGNALYGQWTWKDSERGIVPLRRPPGARYRIRAFDYLIDSVRAYMLNLNRNPAYRELRARRAARRAAGRPLGGLELTPFLDQYSTRREAYTRELAALIRANRLTRFDGVKLERRSPLAPPPPDGEAAGIEEIAR